ncbi:MAG: sigma-E factor negative regulatory protein [Lysobacterales bacterium]|nr:sigma-E factor negative regulatory protein [Xanthomonadales bacterium]MCP5474572.1 sigma-E factor negative regulatory protein [Rhodanobacteraceae bacterium]
MSEDLREQLSALMDGELGRDERAFLMRRLEHDAELRAAWTRMHLIRDVMTHRPGGSATLNLADGVMQALAEEERGMPKARAAASGPAWRPWAGLAVAASVAMAAVFAVAPDRALESGPSLAESAPATRAALPVGVPGPIVPSLQDLGSGVQPVAGERSRVLSASPMPMSAEQMLLMRHGQVVDGSWWVGGTQPVYAQPEQRMVVPVSVSGE